MAAPKIASTTKVTSGQTISGIAAEAGISVAAIAAANPSITNLNRINVGQTIKIPVVDTAVKTAGSTYAGGLTGGANPFAAGSKTSQANLDKLTGASGITPGPTGPTGPTGGGNTPPPTDEFPAAGTVLGSSSVDNGDGTFTVTTIYADGKGGTYQTVTQSGTKTTTTASKVDQIAAISALLSSYGLGDLSSAITEAVQKGFSSDTIQLIMQDPNSKDPLAVAFQTRFPANKTRFTAGKSVLSAAEYLAAERSYTQVLQSYGVSNLATKDRMNSFISNDISAAEVADRVGLAVDRVKNADPFTKAALAEYYPMLNQTDIVAAVLDPAEGLPALKRKVQIAEIGGAAAVQGLKTGLGSMSEVSKGFENVTSGALGAEALASFGITQEEARKGYQTVASIAPRSEFLSSISTGEDYTRLQAEQEAFLGLASAKRARESLTTQEEGRFKGQSGLTKTTLTNKGAGQF
jgi:LysM repeat protein